MLYLLHEPQEFNGFDNKKRKNKHIMDFIYTLRLLRFKMFDDPESLELTK